MRPPRLTMRAASFSALGAPEHSSTYCTPRPRVMRWTASTGSSRLTFTTSSAPSFLPISSRPSRVPVRITGEAPNALATPTPISPIGPGPMTTTPSPAITPPITSSPYIAVPAVTISVASIAHLVRDVGERVDAVDGVFGKSAIGAAFWLKVDSARVRQARSAGAPGCSREVPALFESRQRPTALFHARQKSAAIRETGKRIAALFQSRQDKTSSASADHQFLPAIHEQGI